jgi:hypothetical protein
MIVSLQPLIPEAPQIVPPAAAVHPVPVVPKLSLQSLPVPVPSQHASSSSVSASGSSGSSSSNEAAPAPVHVVVQPPAVAKDGVPVFKSPFGAGFGAKKT